MIKYKFAKNQNKELIKINDLTIENKKKNTFYCISCGNELIARLGKVKTHHFAHKNKFNCSDETYLHLLGKEVFYEKYVSCLQMKKPFNIEIHQNKTCNYYEQDYGHKCSLDNCLSKFDLTQFFDKITLEKREDSFIVDILLSSSKNKEKIFVEIAVTHFSTEKKLNSGYKIIEIAIEHDDDLKPISNALLSVSNSKIKFKNFYAKDITKSICDGNCRVSYNFISLNKDGRCLLENTYLREINSIIQADGDSLIDYKIEKNNNYDPPKRFRKAIATYATENFNIKNCFICRYHANNKYKGSLYESEYKPIFCKFLKITCNSNHAIKCDYFRKEKEYIKTILEEIRHYEYLSHD